MIYEKQPGVPRFRAEEYAPKQRDYCVCIPIINENSRIQKELKRAKKYGVHKLVDIILCDGGSTDGSTQEDLLRSLGVNTLLVKEDVGKQGAQLRMGFWWALERGYKGVLTVDGNNKDSIEDIPRFLEKLEQGYDFVQGSRFIKGGRGVHTPPVRFFSVVLLHAPVISLTARQRFTDTTNAFRAYSRRYLTHPHVQPFREIFMGYELLAYLSVRASQLGLRACEVPVTRVYPRGQKTPTKISFFRGNSELLKILFQNMRGAYHP
ncbi:MAG: glycosyltransferase family 2 protein [Lachnospiraceae bacterium]|jgi:glycosyltransferase involved in cell wall biosynthesis|nr:glycosyltransferase family 2 protein [Lachnospiraceae bacterium]MCI9132618.1 glycosyltransferase family 2 protein [Lachnospiraceae bacterium]